MHYSWAWDWRTIETFCAVLRETFWRCKGCGKKLQTDGWHS
jgi:hypothetical protein